MSERVRASEGRILVVAPTGKDAALTSSFLASAGVEARVCTDAESVVAEIGDGAAALLLTEESLANDAVGSLAAGLNAQPRWSDLPILIVTQPGAGSPVVQHAVARLGNVTVLERPIRLATLISAVRTALRARQRQYEIREYIAERELHEAALSEANVRKDEFLAMLAHELRNPLAPIRNSLHVLQLTREAGAADPRVLEMMERQVGHMVRLVDDLLEVSRITRGKITLQIERLELAAVLRAAVEASRPHVEAAGHRLEVGYPPATAVVEGDPVRLAQVFSNLLNNAAKYTRPGGRIAMSTRVDDDRVVVSVRDNGVGIPAEKLPLVFEMFTQLDSQVGRTQSGLGIGLALVKNLVELHEGTVEARSDGHEKGSEFIVRLPRANGHRPRQAHTSSRAPAGELAARKILVVDDNGDAAESLGSLLGLLGAEVRIANSGASALAAFDAYRPNAVLLDIGMPDIDGYTVARRIRERFDSSAVTLIAMTGWGQEQDRRRSAEAGFDHHLVKPPDIDVLADLLSRSLRETVSSMERVAPVAALAATLR